MSDDKYLSPSGDTYVVMGQNYWGRGKDVAEAKKNFRAQGGVLGKGYGVFYFPNTSTFEGVDQMGRLHWRGTEPFFTEFPAKK